jgi:hypothetical protein
MLKLNEGFSEIEGDRWNVYILEGGGEGALSSRKL